VVHADRHGAVVIPAEAVTRLPEAIETVSRKEKVILDCVRAADFTPDKLRAAVQATRDIH
jgi:regulator of RNase E activity RraA